MHDVTNTAHLLTHGTGECSAHAALRGGPTPEFTPLASAALQAASSTTNVGPGVKEVGEGVDVGPRTAAHGCSGRGLRSKHTRS